MIDIDNKKDCCGCSACEAICGVKAIRMEPDEEGFVYPIIDSSRCVRCGLCERACPVRGRDRETNTESLPIEVLALYNKNSDLQSQSSSGGVFSALAEDCLKRGGVVFGAVYDEKFVVVHRGSDCKDEVKRFRGSKYVQSDCRGVYSQVLKVLKEGRQVLFSGTPCQVDGLKGFVGKEYKNLITVDILCHGVTSPKIFSDYIKFIERYSFGSLSEVFMKDKTFGWGFQNLRLYFRDGHSEFNTPVSNLWNKIFYGHLANRPSCHSCRWTNYKRAGDLSMGDFWGIEKVHPEFYSKQGVSLLLVNSCEGLKQWQRVEEEFEFIESNCNECRQRALFSPSKEVVDRREFWETYHREGFDRTVRRRFGISGLSLKKNYLLQILKSLKSSK